MCLCVCPCLCVFCSKYRVPMLSRVASELSRMAADTTQKTQELQEFCVEVAKYLESCKVT